MSGAVLGSGEMTTVPALLEHHPRKRVAACAAAGLPGPQPQRETKL